MQNKNVVRSVEKAFRLVMFLAEQQGKMGLTEIARELAIDKATALRYLQTLVSLDVIERKDNRYYLGTALFELGNRVPAKQLVIDRIHPILKGLCDDVNETVNLAQLRHHHALYLDKIESRRSLQIQFTIGSRIPLYCSALGKAILATLPEDRRRIIMDAMRMESRTRRTITSRDRLERQVNEIAGRGYSVDNEELEEGLKCVAVPLRIEALDFYGGVSLSGPSNRFTQTTIRRLAELLGRTVQLIREKMLVPDGRNNWKYTGGEER